MTKLPQLRPVTKVSISLHRKPVPKGTLKSILRQADISLEQLLENL